MTSSRFGSAKRAGAICDRCKMSYKHTDLMKDPNALGLRVCKGCRDVFNPYRLPPRQPDALALEWSRPYPQVVGAPEDWFKFPYVAPYQEIPGVRATPAMASPPVPPPPPVEKLSEAQMTEEYVPQRLKARVQDSEGERSFNNKK